MKKNKILANTWEISTESWSRKKKKQFGKLVLFLQQNANNFITKKTKLFCYTRCLNKHGIHLTANKSSNNNVVFQIWTVPGGNTQQSSSCTATYHPSPKLWKWRCPWCSRYRRRKWTRRHESKSWTWLIAFHIALIPLGKVWIQLFSLQLWVNSRTD